VKDQLESVVNFWLENGMDKEHGGVYTCLTREGKIYSKDKSVWMQGRCGWTFAHLCTLYGKKPEWMAAAKSCIDFLENYCKNPKAEGRLYFTVTGDGKPLRQRRYVFSEGFYALANAEYYSLTGEKEYLERARWAYHLIYDINHGIKKDPVGMPPKTEPETRQSRAFADPMIYLNITDVMRRVDPEHVEEYNRLAKESVEEVFNYHFREDLKCTLETVGVDGSLQTDTVAGRVVNPGHDIEASWFIEKQAIYTGDKELQKKAEKIFRYAIEAGWDDKYDGLLYFIDALGFPPEAYEHDMKLWWPHTEIMIASMMFYRDTKDRYYLDWFYKTLDYVKAHFVDPENGEWYGYLRREGLPTEPACKGSTFKGPFHVPRSLMIVDKLMDEVKNS